MRESPGSKKNNVKCPAHSINTRKPRNWSNSVNLRPCMYACMHHWEGENWGGLGKTPWREGVGRAGGGGWRGSNSVTLIVDIISMANTTTRPAHALHRTVTISHSRYTTTWPGTEAMYNRTHAGRSATYCCCLPLLLVQIVCTTASHVGR